VFPSFLSSWHQTEDLSNIYILECGCPLGSPKSFPYQPLKERGGLEDENPAILMNMAAFTGIRPDAVGSLDLTTLLSNLPRILLLTLALFSAYHVIEYLIRPLRSGLRNVPGPSTGNIVSGNYELILGEEQPKVFEAWMKEYGHVVRSKGLLNVCCLSSSGD